MNRPKVWTWFPFAALFLTCLVTTSAPYALGQQDDQQNDGRSYDGRSYDDPPSRVARMNYSQGSVSFQPGGEGNWVEAVPNRPMTTGDNLWADRNARGEMHVGSTAIRFGSETSLTFLDLDDHTTQLRLAQGSVILNVRHLDDDDSVEVDTPNLSFQIQYAGQYRVDVNPDGQATIIDVFRGRGQALGGGNSYTIVANQQAIFRGGADQDNAQDGDRDNAQNQRLDYEINPLPRDDAFDRWSWDRDHREDRSESASYVSREMTGYEDLDANGRWSYDATYGHVWIPTAVDSGWAPYREGHWAFIAPWGWTWVDDEPWGFAPFHYGRWCHVRDSWAWVPGPVVVRPVYAPALVAFVGGGFLSVGFGGGGGLAWFPLGPGEVFVPNYHVSRNYVNQVNVTNTVVNITKVTNVYNTTVINNNTTVVNNNVTKIVYVNQTAPNAVTAVSHDTFVNARPVAHNIVSVSQRDLQQAPVTRMTGIAPVQTSVMGPGRPTRIAPPAAVATRQVVAQRPPAPPVVPLAQRQDPLVSRGPRPLPPPTPAPAQPMPPHQLPPNTSGGNTPAQPMPPHQLPPNPSRVGGDLPRSDVPRPNPPGAPQQPHQLPPNPVRGNAEGTQEITPQRPNSPRPDVARPSVPRPDVPRPGVPQPETPRQPAPSDEGRPQPGWSHPLARPATPPQPKSPQQGQDEERKFNQWQQRERTAPPRPPAEPPVRPQAQPPAHPPAAKPPVKLPTKDEPRDETRR